MDGKHAMRALGYVAELAVTSKNTNQEAHRDRCTEAYRAK